MASTTSWCTVRSIVLGELTLMILLLRRTAADGLCEGHVGEARLSTCCVRFSTREPSVALMRVCAWPDTSRGRIGVFRRWRRAVVEAVARGKHLHDCLLRRYTMRQCEAC